jgi:hypothetical protein
MKTAFIIAATATLLASSTFARQGAVGAIAKQRAKEQVNQSNVRQGVTAPVQPVQPPPSSGTTTSPAQNLSLTRLQAALAAFKSDGAFTAEQKQKFATELSAAALTTKPTPAAASKLAEDMALLLAGKPLTSADRTRLATELDAVLNPSKYPQAKIQAIYDDIQAIFQVNGADRRRAIAIVDDVKGLAAR